MVEDEPSVRVLVERVLTRRGYVVLTAANAAEAYEVVADHDRPIDMLLSDVLLPGGTLGREMADTLRARQPQLPVLFMSGYARDTIVRAGRLEADINFLEKPFTPDQLAKHVREVLDQGVNGSADG